MLRREFLIKAGMAMIAVPAALTLKGCGGDEGGGTAQPAGFRVTSSVDFQHSHSVFVPLADLASPPSGGQSYTSNGASHQHVITLSQQQLTDINSGRTVTVVSNADDAAHTHAWTITKPPA